MGGAAQVVTRHESEALDKATKARSGRMADPRDQHHGASTPPEEIPPANGDQAAAAKDTAAQAKSAVERANNPVSNDVAAAPLGHSPVPQLVALALSLLSILLIRRLRRR